MRTALRFLVTLAVVSSVVAPQVHASADVCPSPPTEVAPSSISPQHLVAAPNGDVDVLYSKSALSKVARVDYVTQGHNLVADAIVPAGGLRPHRVVLDEANGDIWYSLTNSDEIGRLDDEFGGTDDADDFSGDPYQICAPVGIEIDVNGDLWLADVTTDTVTRVDISGDPLVFHYTRLAVVEDAFDGCGPQELATSPDDTYMWFTCNDGQSLGAMELDGSPLYGPLFADLQYPLEEPHAIIRGPSGYDFLFMTEHGANRIDKIDPGDTTPDSATIEQCEIGNFQAPADIIAVGTNTDFDLWFTQPGNNKIGHIPDAQSVDPWSSCDETYEQFALSDDTMPKGITFNEDDGKIWFTEADTDAVGWINSTPTIKECPLPTQEGSGHQTDCDPPSFGLMAGGGDLMDAADEMSPALDLGAEQECQSITHTLSGTLSGTIPDPDTEEPLDLTGKFELTSEVACEDGGKGEDAITSVEISDPILSFMPDEMGIYDRDGTDVSTSGLHGVCHVTNLYFMCSITVAGGWDPVDDQTPDIEKADVSSATLTIVAE